VLVNCCCRASFSERSESKDIVEKLKAVRAKIKAASSEREDVFQQLRELTQARQAQQKNLQDLRRSLEFDEIGQVEARVRELEIMIWHGHFANLAEETKVMDEIKQLNQTKGLITQYQSQRQNQTDYTDTTSSLEERRAAATKRMDDAKKEAEKLEMELEKMREKQDKGAPNMNKLWKEQKELYGKMKDHRATIRTVNCEFKEEMNKYRVYQRELYNYQGAKKSIEAEQRRAEWEKRRAEMDEPVDANSLSDDLTTSVLKDEVDFVQDQGCGKVVLKTQAKAFKGTDGKAAPAPAPAAAKVAAVTPQGTDATRDINGPHKVFLRHTQLPARLYETFHS
jgi:chromosome segregation ATPase